MMNVYNTNNYGYNPYGTYMPQRPMPQPIQQQEPFSTVQSRSILNGKQVDSIDVVRAMDIPMDGSISYFPLSDGSGIITKQLQMDGTCKIVTFKPVIETPGKEVKYLVEEDLKDIKSDLKTLKKELEVLKKNE